MAVLISEKKDSGKDVRVIDCTVYLTPEEGDQIMSHKKQHIPESEYLDLRYLRDMTLPYPFMLPT